MVPDAGLPDTSPCKPRSTREPGRQTWKAGRRQKGPVSEEELKSTQAHSAPLERKDRAAEQGASRITESKAGVEMDEAANASPLQMRSVFLGLQPALGVDGRPAAGTGCRDCLPVNMIMNISGCKDSLYAGL